MDYAERGTVEKTVDRLIEESNGFGEALASEVGELGEGDDLTDEGRAYLTGVLSGILATVRTFADEEPSAFDTEDYEEISRIVDGRSRELITSLSGAKD